MSFWGAADRGDIVRGWLTKVVVVLSLLGVAEEPPVQTVSTAQV